VGKVKRAATALLALLATAAGEAPEGSSSPWESLEAGLDLARFDGPPPATEGVWALRIDPDRFDLRLLNASAPGEGEARTAKAWSLRHDLVAAINASMYQTDHRTSVSLMRTRTHVNNPRLSKDRSVLAFDPLEPDLPRVRLLDRECDDFDVWLPRYGALVQSIRMLSCSGKNVWKPQPQRASTAAIGTDLRGRTLFLHVAPPHPTHDAIEILRRLPLGLERLMYVEGGREAQLFVRAGGRELERVGGGGGPARPLPNVIGATRRAGR
jgi:hypothetical protein